MNAQDLIVPIVVAVVMALKQVPIFTESRRWVLPWIAVLLGIGAATLWAEPAATWQQIARIGLIYGLAAGGLYDGTVGTLAKKLEGAQ